MQSVPDGWLFIRQYQTKSLSHRTRFCSRRPGHLPRSPTMHCPHLGGTYNVLPNEAMGVDGRGPAAHDHTFYFPVEWQLEVLRGVWHWKRSHRVKSICILVNWRNFSELKTHTRKNLGPAGNLCTRKGCELGLPTDGTSFLPAVHLSDQPWLRESDVGWGLLRAAGRNHPSRLSQHWPWASRLRFWSSQAAALNSHIYISVHGC